MKKTCFGDLFLCRLRDVHLECAWVLKVGQRQWKLTHGRGRRAGTCSRALRGGFINRRRTVWPRRQTLTRVIFGRCHVFSVHFTWRRFFHFRFYRWQRFRFLFHCRRLNRRAGVGVWPDVEGAQLRQRRLEAGDIGVAKDKIFRRFSHVSLVTWLWKSVSKRCL